MAWEYGVDYELPKCPVCGAECREVYKTNFNNAVIGCDKCITAQDAYEFKEEQ